MKTKNKFKIGEFSKLNRITVKTLRYYEEIGLMKPNDIDEWTGYRYYDVSQFQKLNTIIELKKLRFSLDEIREMFEAGLKTPSAEMVQKKLNECIEEQRLLQNQYAELLSLEKDIRKGNEMEKVFIKTLPAIIVASYRKVVKDYNELFNLCPNVIGPEMERCGCTCDSISYAYTMEHDKEHHDTNIDIEYCEAVDKVFTESDSLKCKEIPEVQTAVCINHYGSYNNFQHSMTLLMEYLENKGYKIIDNPRFCYIDGIWNKEKEEEWLTEIQCPVKMI